MKLEITLNFNKSLTILAESPYLTKLLTDTRGKTVQYPTPSMHKN